MPFQDAVRICLQRKYVDFTGRARRSEYWFFFLFTVLAGIVGGILDGLFGWRGGPYGGTGPIQGLIQLALLLPSLAVGARRLAFLNDAALARGCKVAQPSTCVTPPRVGAAEDYRICR